MYLLHVTNDKLYFPVDIFDMVDASGYNDSHRVSPDCKISRELLVCINSLVL